MLLWLWMFFCFWSPTVIFAIMIEDRFCCLGQHDWHVDTVEDECKYMPLKTITRCNRCGKVESI
nr:MAG TPA: Rubredoxin metal binding domain [Caudoviricetes sp.]